MYPSFTRLFAGPGQSPQEPGGAAKSKKPIEIPWPLSLFLLPVLFLAGALSIPWTYIHKLVQGRREKWFASQMKALDRLMTWKELELAIERKEGTFIGEYLSVKGPFRLWWTAEDISALSPYKFDRGHHFAWFEPEFAPFFQWCRARFTDPRSGTAKLVSIPEEKRTGLREHMSGVPFVSTCSFQTARRN
jgi:hypothetical protein